MEGKEIGVVFNYFENIGVVAIELFGPIKLGNTIRIAGGMLILLKLLIIYRLIINL